MNRNFFNWENQGTVVLAGISSLRWPRKKPNCSHFFPPRCRALLQFTSFRIRLGCVELFDPGMYVNVMAILNNALVIIVSLLLLSLLIIDCNMFISVVIIVTSQKERFLMGYLLLYLLGKVWLLLGLVEVVRPQWV